jgi:putative transferase (TIGR04331 family)
MPDLLPRSLLEGFEDVEQKSSRHYGRPTDVLVAAYSIDEVQNEFLARCRSAQRRVAFVQHGGFYLQSRVFTPERFLLESGSLFLSWGGRGPNVVPTPNPYLERLRDSHRGGTRITIVEGIERPYVVDFRSQPLGNQTYVPIRMLSEMIRLLPPSRQAHLAFKRFPNPQAESTRPREIEELPTEGPSGGAVAWLASSRLAVILYLDTPFIESMVIGTPTVGLWNPSHWPLRDELAPLFERLEAVGIVHTDPASVAAHIDHVYDDVDAWWSASDVVEARAAFVNRFGLAGDWLQAWTQQLCELRRRSADEFLGE